MESWEPIRQVSNELLERGDEIALDVARRLQEEVASYAAIPVEAVAGPVRASLLVAAVGLRDRRMPTADELAALRAVGAQRAHQGIDLDGPLQVLRIATRTLWELNAARAEAIGVSAATLLAAHQHLWELSDEMGHQYIAGYREAELALSRRAYQHRVDLIRALLLGRRDPAEIADQAVSLGLDPQRRYHVCRARPVSAAGLAELEDALGPFAAALVPLEADVIGLLHAVPDVPVPGTVGVSAAVLPVEAPRAFRLATRALASSLHFGLPGVHSIASLGVRAAISDQEIGEALDDRFLAPLRTGRSHDQEVERTVAAYLAGDLRIEETARALDLHPNTVRQRLKRFEELTGADLQTLPDQFGVWWALQRRAAPRPSGG